MKNISLFFFLFFIIACNQNKDNNDNTNHIIVKKEVIIPIANDEYDLSYLSVVKNINDTTFLFRKSRESNEVYVYNWQTKKRVNKVVFPNDGPNRIINFTQGGIMPISKNKYIIGTINNIYKTINDSIIFHTKLDSNSKQKKSESFLILSQNSFPPIKIGNKLYFRLGSDRGRQGTSAFYSAKILMEYNLKTNKYTKLPLFYPKFYDNKCWGPSRTRFSMTTNNKNELIVLFPIKPVIFKYNLDSNKVTDKISFHSQYVNQKHTTINCKTTGEKKMYHAFKNPNYRAIIFDKYRNIYYLIITLPISKEKYKSVNNPFTINPFVIMILDKDLKVIAEKKFKGGIYHISDFFVTKEGFWLSKNSPHNPNYDENKLKFDLIGLKQ